ncbi:MAG: alpha/beta hydrolase [Actinomycetota bacterium]
MTVRTVEQHITSDDGVSLWVRDVGDLERPAVLCFHGGPGLGDYLEPVEEALTPAFRVVRWDQRGAGRSDAAGPFTIDRFVADADAVADAVGLDRYVSLGHSSGANLAMQHVMTAVGRRAPDVADRIAGVVHIAGTGVEWWPGFSMLHKEYQVRRLGPEAGARLAQLRTGDRSPDEDRELRLLYIRSELHDTEDLGTAQRLYDAEQSLPGNQEANAALNEDARKRSLEQQIIGLSRVRCPVLVLHGASDPRPIDALASMIATLPQVQVKIINGAGHSPWLEQPEQLWELVTGFVRLTLPAPG